MGAFQKATRKKAKARIGIVGPAGSGKTYSALQLAFGMGGKVAVIDTEHGSADLYAELGEYDVAPILPPFTVQKYLNLIKEAEKSYDIVIVDSLSHAWAGTGGLLEEVDKRSGSGNKFTAWRDITPLHNSLIDAILQSPAHIICTMRSKTEYVIEENDKGKKVPRKVGMAPVQREGMDYEFTLVFDIEQSRHFATASKDRTSLFDGTCEKIDRASGERIRVWLESGDTPPPPKIDPPPAASAGKKPELTEAQTKYFPRVKDALDYLFKTDTQAKMAEITTLTTFKGDNGEMVEGVADYRKLDGKRLQILAHKLESTVKSAKKNAEAGEVATCPECNGPLTDGYCYNQSCPEGQPPPGE